MIVLESTDILSVVKELESQGKEVIVVLQGNKEDVERMREISTPSPEKQNPPHDIEADVTHVLREIGVPANLLGYQYLREAIIMSINDSKMVNSITKVLYPSVAKKCGTTPSRAERAIRHAIETSWSRGNMKAIDDIFGYTINNRKGKPTNSEFIALIVDKLRLSYR